MRVVSKLIILVVLLSSLNTVSANLTINSDHTTSINGVKTFPVSMYALCNRFFEYYSNCDDSLAINNNQTFHFSNGVEHYGNDANGYPKYIPKFENAGVGFSVLAKSLPIANESVRNSTYIYISQLTADQNINYRGIDEPDYANITQRNQVINNYNKSNMYYPNTMKYMNNYDHLFDWLPYLDIYGYDGYANTESKFASYYTRADVVYAHERWFMQIMNNKKWNDSAFNNKSVWTVIAAYAVDGPTEVSLTLTEARAITWDSIASGSQGISFYGWLPYSGTPSPGVWSNVTIAGWYREFATEIRSLNSILILPTTSFFWENDRNESYVNITPNPSKTVYGGWPQQKQFVYLLKQPNASVSYLIAVNKDINPISNVQIKVGGLSGSQTVRTLGNQTTGSQKGGRIISATNGVFNDSFDGYAVHIYEIAPSNAAPIITSWSNNKTNNYNTTLTVNISETVRFNTTSNQTIDTWNWYLNNINQLRNFDNFSYIFSSPGIYTVKVNAFNNTNGISSTITWNVNVQTPQIQGTPSITSWSNNRTNNKSLTLTINSSELINFNATANQTIDTWSWFKDDVNQIRNYDNFTTNFSVGTHTIKVNATNANGTADTVAWTVTVGLASPKFGAGGNDWDAVGISSNVYIENSILKLGFWGENFDDGLYDWTTVYGNITVSNGKISMYGNVNAYLTKTIGNHSDVAMFAAWTETNMDGFKQFVIRSDTSRDSPDNAYWASARADGSGAWIVKKNETGSWVNVNETGTFTRTPVATSYCIEKAYGNTFVMYCSHTSYADALASTPVSQGTDSSYAYGNRIIIASNFNTTRGTDITTFDNLRMIPTDASGNLINSGSKTVYYDAGANNQTNGFIINATTPSNTNYTVSYRQKYDGSWIPIGETYTGNQTISISGTKYQETEINITLFGNGTSFPDIETIEFISEQAADSNVYPSYDVNKNRIVDMDDMTIVGQHFNEIVSIPYPRYDVNMDGLVNIDDITIVGQHFGEKF